MDDPARVQQLLALSPRAVAVVLVDLQNDFCHPEAFGQNPPVNTLNAAMAIRANAFATHAAERGFRVIYTRQELDPDRLSERQRRWEVQSQLCRSGSWGSQLFVPPVEGAAVVTKDRFDVWQSQAFLKRLEDWEIDGIIICGLELQCCLLYAVLGASERGFHYVVPLNLVSGLDSCETTSNRAVKDFLRFVQPTVADAYDLLAVDV
jgi:nicotinamidase-related amidase